MISSQSRATRKLVLIRTQYTVQLRPTTAFPQAGSLFPAKVPIQVVITSARVPESTMSLHWSNKYIPWTCAISQAVQAHVIDMSEISDAFLSRTSFLWDVLKIDEHLPLVKHKPVPAYDLEIFRFDSLIVELRPRLTSTTSSKAKKSKERWAKWLKSGST